MRLEPLTPLPGADNADSIVLGFCHGAQVNAAFMRSLIYTLEAQRDRIGNRMIGRQSGTFIDIAQDLIAREFLASSVGWLLMVETDIEWHPWDISTLLRSAHPVTAPVVGGLYHVDMGTGRHPCAYDWTGGPDGDDDWQFLFLDSIPEAGVHKVGGIGLGFTLIHRTALIRLQDAYPDDPTPFFPYTHKGQGRAVTSDVGFCRRLHDQDIPVYVNCDIHLDHHKMGPLHRWTNSP